MQITADSRLVFQAYQATNGTSPQCLSPCVTPSTTDGGSEVAHDLHTCKIRSIDTPNGGKFLCRSNRHHCLILSSKEAHRKLYFLSFEQMQAGIDFLIFKGQGFASRANQYKVIGRCPDPIMDSKLLVRHRVTHDKLIMKFIRHDDSAENKA